LDIVSLAEVVGGEAGSWTGVTETETVASFLRSKAEDGEGILGTLLVACRMAGAGGEEEGDGVVEGEEERLLVFWWCCRV
jgi:hypothetical protein